MMLISARRMFVPGGRLARRLARRLGRRTAGSQFFFTLVHLVVCLFVVVVIESTCADVD